MVFLQEKPRCGFSCPCPAMENEALSILKKNQVKVGPVYFGRESNCSLYYCKRCKTRSLGGELNS